jgi:hypothetical protein
MAYEWNMSVNISGILVDLVAYQWNMSGILVEKWWTMNGIFMAFHMI